MSFFKKLTKEFEELKTSFSDDKPAEKKEEKKDDQQQHTGERNFGDHSQQQQQYGGYGSGAPPSNYPYPSQAQPQSGPDHGYGSQPSYAQTPPPAPQSAAPPMAAPPVSSGWLVQWDTTNNRWFYVDQSTGRSQWEHPSPPTGPQGGSSYAPPPVPPHPSSDTRAFGGDQGHGYGSPAPSYGGAAPYGAPSYGGSPAPYGQAPYGGAPSPYGQPPYGQAPYGQDPYAQQGGNNPYGDKDKEKKSNSSGMLLGAAGGLAVGAVGGALIANALNDSDDESKAAAAAAPAAQPQYGGYQDPYADSSAPPAVLPPTDADGESVSSSDREDVQDARAEYEEALADAADSDASSSDHERLEEAREEYEETYEEVYGDDD
ncbi:Putative WW domain-containing protein [Colletotrichum destructivum]|uniref:WW domain-containing protein n=1 Tax=Colletotrichum destructivum TaxID=34406 RepID=A0AAX4I4N5_9PEZI|nr:Putative WW domain-containing protein [Colletotrichum destructivum]